MSAILYPSRLTFKYTAELPVVIVILLCYAALNFSASLYLVLNNGSSSSTWVTYWCSALFTVSQVAPDLIPLADCGGRTYGYISHGLSTPRESPHRRPAWPLPAGSVAPAACRPGGRADQGHFPSAREGNPSNCPERPVLLSRPYSAPQLRVPMWYYRHSHQEPALPVRGPMQTKPQGNCRQCSDRVHARPMLGLEWG